MCDMTEKIRDYNVNGAMIIGVDNGYGNMKTARRCFKTALAKYDSEPVLSRDYLEYEGKFYVIGEGHKGFVADKEYLNKFIVSLAAQWSANESIVISTADAEGLKKYFAANAKALLDKGVRIEEVNGTKSLFTISPADGSYKVNFGEEEFENYFKDFLRPQLVEMLF